MKNPIKYKNRLYKNLLQLYDDQKTEDSPSTYSSFRKRLDKVKAISKAIKKNDKRLRYDYYKEIYLKNKNDKSVGLPLFVKRMRKGMKLEYAISRKSYKAGNFIIEGKKFSSLAQIGKYYRIRPQILNKRYNRGVRGKQLLFGVKNIIKYKNNIYSNKKEFCSKFNISYHLLYRGLKEGKSLESIIEGNKTPKKRTNIKQTIQNKKKKIKQKILPKIDLPTNFIFNGARYKTVKNLADTVKIDYTTIFRRIKKGNTIEEAVKLGSPRGKYNLKIIANNKTYNSINDFAIKNNLSRKFLKEHVAKGMSLSEILLNKNTLKRKVGKDKRLLSYKNIKMTYEEATKKFNLHQSTIMNFLNTGKTLMDLEKKINLKKKLKKITFNNVEYSNIEDFIKSNNINIKPSLFKQRLTRGFSIEKILKQGKKIDRAGGYNLKVFLKNQELANMPGCLYFLKIKINQNYLYKIGITKNKVEDRVKTLAEIPKKNITILKYKTGNLIDCFKLEQKILKIYSKYKFLEPSLKYTGGRTEIFKLNNDQINEILILLDK